ncbi:carotenoid oxygenase family protein [Aurantiacibacter gilvus]|uniref:Dioxygenase n=1 Tax=Aurantiacibacter gilvus TaxID=3139141 RepID=A0ABU9IAY3_9SPHN
MTLSYEGYPSLQGDFEPARFNSQIHDCEIVGELPPDLDGTFYRVGGEWFYPPKYRDDSPFAADGIATMFRIANGSCDFASRFVETPRYLANKAARQQLFGYYRNPFTHEGEQQGQYGRADTQSNTNIIVFAGKLLALKEDAPPMELDPDTLETRGFFDFDGAYTAPTFTAHPKVDGRTGEMIAYGYEAEGLASNAIWLYTIAADGTVTSERKFAAPFLSMVHDIAISQNYVLIPVYGMVSSMERLQEGKVHWGWDRSKPSHIGVLSRHGSSNAVRWFTGPAMAMVHTFSATDRDGVITLDAAVSDGNPFPFFPDVEDAPFDGAAARTTIRRYVIDMNSADDGWTEEKRFQDKAGALSRIDDRFLGHDFRYGLLGYADEYLPFAGDAGGRRPVNSLGKFDLAGGTVESMFAGPEYGLAEVAFAPRSPDAAEADGWVMALATNYETMKSELVIGDTRDLAAGPVAKVRLPFKAPGQVHGNWVPRWMMPS